jgi:hypothetical protein
MVSGIGTDAEAAGAVRVAARNSRESLVTLKAEPVAEELDPGSNKSIFEGLKCLLPRVAPAIFEIKDREGRDARNRCQPPTWPTQVSTRGATSGVMLVPRLLNHARAFPLQRRSLPPEALESVRRQRRVTAMLVIDRWPSRPADVN